MKDTTLASRLAGLHFRGRKESPDTEEQNWAEPGLNATEAGSGC